MSIYVDENTKVVIQGISPTSQGLYHGLRNRAYGTKACQFLGTKLGGKGKVIMFEGDLASINGRDRTDAFNECMKQNFPGITVFGEATEWKGDVAASKFLTRLASDPDIRGVYMGAAPTRARAPQAAKAALERWDFKTMKRKRLHGTD